MGTVAAYVKSALPSRQWRRIRRATNRLRWPLKFSLLRRYEFPISQRPMRALRYVLWDPEVESYTYQMGNEREYAQFLAGVLGTEPQQVQRWIEEANTDPYLSRDRGFHWSSKRRMPLGNRLMWYPIARALKPRVIVEAGVHEGLGSEMFLVALKRNAAEGSPGKLISFDIHEDTGWLVHPDLRALGNWQFELEATSTGLERALRDIEVDLFVHETPHTDELIRTELDAVLRRAGPRLGVIDSSGQTTNTLRGFCDRLETSHHFFQDEPHDHIVRSHGMGLAIFDRSKIAQRDKMTEAA
jgi:Methyltransferase domain